MIIRKLIKRILLFVSKTRYLKFIGLTYGKNCRFIDLRLTTFGSEAYAIFLGHNVTVTSGVCFITHDGGVWVFRDKVPTIDVIEKIQVGNNVFIGTKSIILPGTVIQDNCVIGAGSVVKGQVEGNSVYVGVPARRICSLEDYKKRSLAKNIGTKGLNYFDKKEQVLNSIQD